MASQKPLSGWWPIGLGATVLLLYIIGGALIGSWYSCYTCSSATYYVGLVIIIMALLVKIAFIVSLVLYVKRRKYKLYGAAPSPAPWGANAGLLNNPYNPQQPIHNDNYAYMPPGQQHYEHPAQYDAMPLKDNLSKEPLRQGTPGQPPVGGPQGPRYCAQCNAPVYTPFCANCGWHNPA